MGSGKPSFVRRTDLPLASHSVIFLHITGPGVVDEWIKLEFGRDGLKFDFFDHYTPIGGAYLDEECPANPVKPNVVADALKSCKHKTYNVVSWNCNHVANNLWDAVVKSSYDAAMLGWGISTACSICMERERSMIFVPCGHHIACQRCAEECIRCPI